MNTLMQAAPADRHEDTRLRAAYQAAGYVQRHALGLYEIVDLLGSVRARDAVETLIAESRAAFLDPDALADALMVVFSSLDDASFERIEDQSHRGRGPRNPFGAIAWHGARISELLIGFQPR